jgi:hypothetical protein
MADAKTIDDFLRIVLPIFSAIFNRFSKPKPSPDYWKAVKLIHAEELQTWQHFHKYQDFQGISYHDYFLGVKHIQELRTEVSEFISAKNRLEEIDRDEMVVHDKLYITVPRSLLGKTAVIPLTRDRLPETIISSDLGEVLIDEKNAVLHAPTKRFKKQVAKITYSCPSNVRYADEILLIRQRLADMSEETQQKLAEVEQSKFNHPVLFVSHRWESIEHPDPLGQQLQKLCALKDCFIIYDYSSFPQLPRSAAEEADFQQIIKNMDQFIKNAVILHSPDYLERGWCVYEYIVSSLRHSIVCDEVSHPDFVDLRNWASTRVPIGWNPFRDSTESRQQNYISQQILSIANKILPIYKNSHFRTEYDSTYVTALLRQYLQSKLPAKRKHLMGGEWERTSWTEEDLLSAFDSKLQWRPQQSLPVLVNQTNVPSTIAEAVEKGYKIDRESLIDFLNPVKQQYKQIKLLLDSVSWQNWLQITRRN